jgi:hypothetical protein
MACGEHVLSAEVWRRTGSSKPHEMWSRQAHSDEGRQKDARRSKNGAAPGMKFAELVQLNKEYVVAMELLIGPLIERNGGYSYDTFTREEGLRSSFRYLRLDAARYDQRALVAEAKRDPHRAVRVCETLTEFLQRVDAAKNGELGSPAL